MKNIKSLILSIDSLENWIDKNGWAGYDPYDLKELPFYIWLKKDSNRFFSFPKKILRHLFVRLETLWPLQLRLLFGVDKCVNAKGMGLFAKAYLNLYQITNKEKHREKAIYCLKWLQNNTQQGYQGACWGYPFNWQSVIMIPEGTPSSVVTCIVGDAFWHAYKVLDDKQYLQVCRSICGFLTNDLNQAHISEDIVCFSYTPIDNFHVHNANLFVAEFLTRIGNETGNSFLVSLGRKAGEYALSEQNEDGSLYYWGLAQKQHGQKIDHYHSGFEIRCLHGIWKNTGDIRYKQAVDHYYQFYLDQLMTVKDGIKIPKMRPSSIYPINIHACAEALICNIQLSSDYKDTKQVDIDELLSWIISNMQTKKGWFIYQKIMRGGKLRSIQVPYIRWGQAWMLLALSSSYKNSISYGKFSG